MKISPEKFQRLLVVAIIRHDLKKAIVEEFGISQIMVEHWALGTIMPHSIIMEEVFTWMSEMVENSEKEITGRLQTLIRSFSDREDNA